MPPKRFSLVERAEASLQKNSSPPLLKQQQKKFSSGFEQRQQAALIKNGQSNAASSSRVAEIIEYDEEMEEGDGQSVGGRSMVSHAPSLHPSIAHSTFSLACSEVTIGAGDQTGYWDFMHRSVTQKDLGHSCRECKLVFRELGEPLTERRGARTSTRYHADCFSGFADPRSQANSSMHVGRLAGTQMEAAPKSKAGSKMRSSTHFENNGSDRTGGGGGGGGGKIAAFLGGGNNFGLQSSKNEQTAAAPGAAEHGGMSMADLEAHNKQMDQENK